MEKYNRQKECDPQDLLQAVLQGGDIGTVGITFIQYPFHRSTKSPLCESHIHPSLQTSRSVFSERIFYNGKNYL